MNQDTEAENSVQAVKNTFVILEAIKGDAVRGTVTDIANSTGLAKSTVHKHLKTLERDAWIMQSQGEYGLTLRWLNYGGHVQVGQQLYHLGHEDVTDLAEETGERSQLMVEQGGRGYYLHQAQGEKAIKTDSHLGTEIYLHATALGKALLAHYPEEKVDAIIDQHGLPARTPHTITERERLLEELERVRRAGVAFDDEERIAGMRCVAAPILIDKPEIPHGAVSISGPATRISGEYFHESVPELVTRTAQAIEIKATYA